MDGQIHQSTKGLFAIVNQIGWELLLSNDTARTYFSGGSRSSGIPEIRGGGGGGAGNKKIFSALWASVWSKNKGGGGPGPLGPSS